MPTKSRIAVAIDPVVLRNARTLAARRGITVSAMLEGQLRQLLADDAGYAAARRRATALFRTPLELDGNHVAD